MKNWSWNQVAYIERQLQLCHSIWHCRLYTQRSTPNLFHVNQTLTLCRSQESRTFRKYRPLPHRPSYGNYIFLCQSLVWEESCNTILATEMKLKSAEKFWKMLFSLLKRSTGKKVLSSSLKYGCVSTWCSELPQPSVTMRGQAGRENLTVAWMEKLYYIILMLFIILKYCRGGGVAAAGIVIKAAVIEFYY